MNVPDLTAMEPSKAHYRGVSAQEKQDSELNSCIVGGRKGMAAGPLHAAPAGLRLVWGTHGLLLMFRIPDKVGRRGR